VSMRRAQNYRLLTLSDWEVASLPGGFDPSVRSASIYQSLEHNIVYDEAGVTRSHHFAVNRARPVAKDVVPADYRRQIQTASHGVYPANSRWHRDELPIKISFTPSPAYIKSQSGQPPDAYHQLQVTWQTILKNLSLHARIARQLLDEVCSKTEAYVATPGLEDDTIPIWGTPEQVELALRELDSFASHVRESRTRPPGWHKNRAFDGRVESRKYEDEEKRAEEDGRRTFGDEKLDYDHQAHLMWPEEIIMEKFIKRHGSSTIPALRGKITCKVEFVDKGMKHIKISAESKDDTLEIFRRVRNMVKEEIALLGRFIIANRFRLPRAHMYRNKVGIDKDRDVQLFYATLHGGPLPEEEYVKYRNLCLKEDEKNLDIITRVVTQSIESLHLPERHVRMRATFAELGFARLEFPEGSDLFSDHADYMFDSFWNMITDRNTILRPLGLQHRGPTSCDIVQAIQEDSRFTEPETRYVLHFDLGARNSSQLRLERELRYPAGSDELAVHATRWLEYGKLDDDEILEVNLLDFENPRANIQLHIGAPRLFNKPGADLQAWANQVRFSAPKDGIRATPRSRTSFPPGRQDLLKVEETTIARFRYKEGEGYLEISRKDIYPQSIMQKQATPSSIEWAACYYYPAWDTFLGEFASIGSGQEVTWTRELSTFFGDPNDPLSCRLNGVPRGFNVFMEELSEISGILQGALEASPVERPVEHYVAEGMAEETKGSSTVIGRARYPAETNGTEDEHGEQANGFYDGDVDTVTSRATSTRLTQTNGLNGTARVQANGANRAGRMPVRTNGRSTGAYDILMDSSMD
jgi:hypothetical protein